jgi:glycerophosphoryl diester phosphodiesterase
VAAFRAALDLGADGVELDVHPTADDVLVVRHDPTVAGGAIAELDLRELRAGAPEVPTLAEALDAGAGSLVDVEVKHATQGPGADPGHRVAELLVELLAERGWRDEVVVSSFALAAIDRVHALAPTVPTALLTIGTAPLDGLAMVVEHGHTALHPDVVTLLGGDAPGAIAAVHGADAVITNAVGVALRALGRG